MGLGIRGSIRPLSGPILGGLRMTDKSSRALPGNVSFHMIHQFIEASAHQEEQ